MEDSLIWPMLFFNLSSEFLAVGSGLRMQTIRLLVKDVEFDHLEVTVRNEKGGKDRRTRLPRSLVESLRNDIAQGQVFHEHDSKNGVGPVYLPFALVRK